MTTDWTLEHGKFGPRLLLRGAWSMEALAASRSAGVRELELNYAKGWTGHDYSFLSQLPSLEALEITDWNATDVASIHALPSLRRLKVFTYCKTRIDFSAFPELEECSLEWRTKARSVFQHTGLKKLFVNKYRGKNLASFAGMKLESLSLASPQIEVLDGVSKLGRLAFLGLYAARRLGSLEGLQHLGRLTHLEVNDCPQVQDISPLSGLRELVELHLCNDGDIDTLRPLASDNALRVLLFYESTNIRDGDLRILKELRDLEHVVFMGRPHYSHKPEEFPRRKLP